MIIRLGNDELDGLGSEHCVSGDASAELCLGMVALEAFGGKADGRMATEGHDDRPGGDDAEYRDGGVRHAVLAAIPGQWQATGGDANRDAGGVRVGRVFAAVLGAGEGMDACGAGAVRHGADGVLLWNVCGAVRRPKIEICPSKIETTRAHRSPWLGLSRNWSRRWLCHGIIVNVTKPEGRRDADLRVCVRRVQ